MLRPQLRLVNREISIDVGSPSQADTSRKLARHPALTIAIHWTTVTAIVIAVAVMFVRDAAEDRALRQYLLDLHRQLGLLVLIGAGVRIALRLGRGLANHAPNMSPMLRWAAQGAHVLLYAVLLALPLLGWAVTSAHGIKLTVLGIVPLPQIVSADSELADTLTDYHVRVAWGLLTLVTAHAGAACWHHFVRRDSVLRAMLPRVTRGS